MPEGNGQIKCVVCGAAFPAKEAAKVVSAIQMVSLSQGLAQAEDLSQKCPQCAQKGALGEAEAIAKALLIGEDMRLQLRTNIHPLVKRVGLVLAGLAFFCLVLLRAYARLPQNERDPVLGTLILLLVMAGGIGAFIWAQVQSKKESGRKFR